MPSPGSPTSTPTEPPSPTTPPSGRSTVRRLPERGSYDAEPAYAILDEGIVAHVGLAGADGPVVIPMLYARDGDRLLLHGSPASRLLRTAASGVDVCVTVTLVDGLVLARSAFHHSVNYRSVVVFGRATRVQDIDERRAALDVLVDGVVPGRTAEARPPNDKELRGTLVLALPLDELSVKVRSGGPVDEPEDYDRDVWAGVLPLPVVPAPLVPDEVQPPDRPVPPYLAAYARPPRAGSR
jgi:hypothetical protein